ncbi:MULTISPECIES: nucleoside 2-deoxyribosyltransferase [Bradyrhizobium]|jgi:nucleoside 2-deoxyribosyltransferase|uniref:nucleoside 2-deoxyribosyltransferase n=1 Tax=Bradyrhizobium TaxID=374 RepID=UPI00046353E3|nr:MULTISPECIES: nucleoside 2-deoxyribosyltransferase [Bradyrhizobium]KIU52074.1 nucleoside 2-deoxyribosyltransferase [Bradyrhizobium elkanii]OCX29107.1 nucleoside 2-deoxyribosyltransferase [Bradyrhizobium sp. UASWS1016]
MIIAGGSYLEICLRPEWRRLFGSGLRAACAIAPLSVDTQLHTYGFEGWADDIRHTAAAFGAAANVHPIADAISFSYDHPLSPARRHPGTTIRNAPIVVQGAAVLRFGFVEGDAVVEGERVVYDPQSSDISDEFGANGSRAKHLALVLNEMEAGIVGGSIDVEGLMRRHRADIAVVKRGPWGATVHEAGKAAVEVPIYRSNSVFKIGSGDVFSAAFALFWAERGLDASAAADSASRCVARFVDGHVLPLSEPGGDFEAVRATRSGSIYLAGPFFDLAQRWMIEEAYRTLIDQGVEVFSPLHEIGTGLPADVIARADLQGLRKCAKVLALLDGADPGTLFEVGYARALDIPVVALAERFEEENLTMIAGSGCDVVRDFATAVYRVLWTSGE